MSVVIMVVVITRLTVCIKIFRISLFNDLLIRLPYLIDKSQLKFQFSREMIYQQKSYCTYEPPPNKSKLLFYNIFQVQQREESLAIIKIFI